MSEGKTLPIQPSEWEPSIEDVQIVQWVINTIKDGGRWGTKLNHVYVVHKAGRTMTLVCGKADDGHRKVEKILAKLGWQADVMFDDRL